MNETLSRFDTGKLTITFIKNERGNAGLILTPIGNQMETDLENMPVDPLVHIMLEGDNYHTGFMNGASMRGSRITEGLLFDRQTVSALAGGKTLVQTYIKDGQGLCICHYLIFSDGMASVECYAGVKNDTGEKKILEMLTSFSMNVAVNKRLDNERCYFHRMLSSWSSENRMSSASLPLLNFEESWSGTGARTLRYGAVGSLPVRNYYPFGALQDRGAGVTWAAVLEAPCSWQMELTRFEKDRLCLSGGIGDYEFAHFRKNLEPGEEFVTPKAIVTAVCGDEEDALRAINRHLTGRTGHVPPTEKNVPVIFNEFCTTWGNPSIQKIKTLADAAHKLGVAYFVIDAGWYQTDGGGWENNMGDWIASGRLFPNGLKEACDYIRARGMIPGLWFELEAVGEEADAAQNLRHLLLKRNGHIIKSGKRRFWNMADGRVVQYLDERVIRLLKDAGVGYIKIDYNESIGIGCDGFESLGEGLRANIECSQRYFKKLTEKIDGLVLELCASGGHRAEPSFLGLASMNSFSDAHECPSIPIIAANVGRVVPARQNQVWSVLRRGESENRTYYSLAAAMLGRMCISGDLDEMPENQLKIVGEAINFYDRIKPLILEGDQYIYRNGNDSYQEPAGSQVVVRKNGAQMMAVCHAFAKGRPVTVEIEPGCKRMDSFGAADAVTLDGARLVFEPREDFTSAVVLWEY